MPGQAQTLPRCSVFIATSLDGCIARLDGSIDWLERANAVVPPGEDCGFEHWAYAGTPVIAMSRRPLTVPPSLPDSVSTTNETPLELLLRLGSSGVRRVYVDGGLLVQAFLRAGLIDDLTITVIPILLGVGRPLFGPLERDVGLQHVSTRVFDFGFVQHQYRVA